MLPFVLQREGLLFTRVIFLSFDSLVSCYSREVRCAVSLPGPLLRACLPLRVRCPVRTRDADGDAGSRSGVLDTVECGADTDKGFGLSMVKPYQGKRLSCIGWIVTL